MSIFAQSSFIGGMDSELDATKTPANSYRILVNGRSRRDIIEPTNKHLPLDIPNGNNLQGIFAAGDYVVIVIDGLGYYMDLSEVSPTFRQIIGLGQFDASIPRIYGEIIPYSSSFFNRNGTPDEVTKTFNVGMSPVPQALFLTDGKSQARLVFADGSVKITGTFETWTKDIPDYVPLGVIPAMVGSKLLLADPTRRQILLSTSGRPTDFVVNITADGDKGGDAYTTAQTVSYNEITAIKALSTGQALVGTLYGSWVLDFDYTNLFFGEPFPRPVPIFPTGPLNEISIIPLISYSSDGIYGDLAFITQTGIHAFNAVAQSKRESNNFPLGAKIHGILNNPQADTAAVFYDDYGFFNVSTIFGYGSLVYDTIRRTWASLDLSFGRVKQFAVTRITGRERMFFITHDNRAYEAFASEDINSTRVYIGEWTPQSADQQILSHMVDAQFLNVKNSGQVKFSIYADGKKREEKIVNVDTAGYEVNVPIVLPAIDALKTQEAAWQYGNRVSSWNLGVMVEWNFNGALGEISVDGEIQTADNVKQTIPSFGSNATFAVIGSSGYGPEIRTAVEFPAEGYLCIPVEKGKKYIYYANGNGRLSSGNILIEEIGIFTANQDSVAIEGRGDAKFSLKEAGDFLSVMDSIRAANPFMLLGAGNHSFESGLAKEIKMGLFPINLPFLPVAGEVDCTTLNGALFYGATHTAKNYVRNYDYVDFFFYSAVVSGYDKNSDEATILRSQLAASEKPFKIVILGYGENIPNIPFQQWGASAVIESSAEIMARVMTNGFPTFIVGAGGHGHGVNSDNAIFSNNTHFGYLAIKVDALSCLFTFKNTAGETLDEFAIYG